MLHGQKRDHSVEQVKVQEQIESFPVWFSYSGAQSEFVQAMYTHMSMDKVQPLARRALELNFTEHDSRFNGLRFVPFGYQLENGFQADSLQAENHTSKSQFEPLQDCDTRISRLTGADRIESLMRDISSSLFKVLVLSPEFFQSEACMKELCLSLTSFTTTSNNQPFIVFYGFDNPQDVLNEGKYPFYSSDKPMTLSQALMQTRAKLLAEDPKLKRHYTLEFEDQRFFKELLARQSKKVYFDASELLYTNKQDTANVSFFASQTSVSTAKFLVTELYRYCYRIMKLTAFVTDKTYLDNMYREWSRKYQVRELVSYIEDEKHLRFEAIRQLDEVENFTRELKGYLEGLSPKELLPMDALLYQLCQILILKGLTCTGTDLRQFFARESLPIQIFVEDDSQSNFENSHHANLVFCAAFGMTPKSKPFLAGDPVAKTRASGCISPASFAPDNSNNDMVLLKAFEDLWESLFPTEGGLDVNSLSAFKQNRPLRERIRTQIKAKKYNRYGFLLLQMDAHGDGKGGFPILDNMVDILNLDLEGEEVPIPAVILRRHLAAKSSALSNAGVSKMDIMFSQNGHSQLHNDLADIRAIYQEAA